MAMPIEVESGAPESDLKGEELRVYISGPITGISNYLDEFKKVEDYLKKEYGNVDIVNPAEITSMLPGDMQWYQYMDVTLNILRACDAIFLMEGWEKSKGAQIEKLYAEGCGMVLLSKEGARFHKKKHTNPS